ncbi:GINS complex, Psf3 component [Mytilinidion resinicola]|uniref:DNA replication complex GINS protein PSF3 n=1 Tax=Mytilinidion resinicola TaxID=574789 RepID=A0A6A6YWY7_9PEZI|nr:GINS complex, Psf3 component [Mytilinidion resinicola]KAF2812514.1 GINS complex, Psf3 component [Mytilinidion resinicola]
MSYYDIDAILTDAQKVPCTFELTVPGLGFLDGNMDGDMKKDSKVELPIWLGEMLSLSEMMNTDSLVTLSIPSALGPRVFNALKADPRTVDLRALASHFYNLATRLLEMYVEDINKSEEQEMIRVLSETFKARAAVIADQANNVRGTLGEGADFLRGLDENERQLFRAAHDSAKSVRAWVAEGMKKK